MVETIERFEKVDIEKLIPYVRNSRTHSKEQIIQLRGSLREFGFINPCLIDKDYNVIAGHGRICAAKEEGIAEVPCIFVEHLTEAQKRAYIIADNRLAMNAGWDDEMLTVELSDLQGADFDLDLLGFDVAENWISYSIQSLTLKKMILMSMQNLNNQLLARQVIYGF